MADPSPPFIHPSLPPRAVEGIITVGVGLISFFIIPDAPETAKFLSHDERSLAVRRLASEHIGKQTGGKTTGKAVKQGFANIQVSL